MRTETSQILGNITEKCHRTEPSSTNRDYNDDDNLSSARNESRYMKWYNKLSDEKKKQYLASKRGQVPESYKKNSESVKQTARNDYQVPEKRCQKTKNI